MHYRTDLYSSPLSYIFHLHRKRGHCREVLRFPREEQPSIVLRLCLKRHQRGQGEYLGYSCLGTLGIKSRNQKSSRQDNFQTEQFS